MKAADINDLERSLEISVPPCYGDAVSKGLLSGFMNADSQSVTGINTGLRNGDFGDTDWPHNLFAFADDGCGSFYCLDLSLENVPVLIRDHETLELKPAGDRFTDWIRSRH